jgi:hypothetical protein
MTKLIAQRLGAMLVVLLVLSAAVFVLQQLTPTDPVHAMLGANSSKATIAAERHKLGYDRPLPVQYLRYVGDLLRGNLQMSLRTRRPVRTDLGAYLPATMELLRLRARCGEEHAAEQSRLSCSQLHTMTALALLELAWCLEPGQLVEVTVALFDPAAHGLDKQGSHVDFLDVHVPRRSQ